MIFRKIDQCIERWQIVRIERRRDEFYSVKLVS